MEAEQKVGAVQLSARLRGVVPSKKAVTRLKDTIRSWLSPRDLLP